jgi:hypothetical protein
MQTTRSFRGISRRLAINYLENLGGESVEGEWDVAGDGWRATLSERKVAVGRSLELNEVTVTFEGEEAALDELIPKFARKAMRAGG